jgi:hypothetical protein
VTVGSVEDLLGRGKTNFLVRAAEAVLLDLDSLRRQLLERVF